MFSQVDNTLIRIKFTRIVYILIIFLIVLVWLSPLYIAFHGAFKESVLAGRAMGINTLQQIYDLWSKGIIDALYGSFIVGTFSAAFVVALSLGLIIFCLEKVKLNTAFQGAIVGRCIPPIALLVAQFVIIMALGIPDGRGLLVLFHIFQNLPIALVVLLPRAYELHEKSKLGDLAKLDGVGRDSYLLKILVPLMRREIIFAGLLCFGLSWGEFLYAGIFCAGPTSWTLPVLMGTLETSQKIEWGILYAAITVSVLGTLILSIGLSLVLWFWVKKTDIKGENS